jgi:plastocyanin
MTFSRRTIVAAATGLVGSLAGCSGGSGGGGNGGGEETDAPTATTTATATPTATATSTPTGPPEDAPVQSVTVENKTFIPMVAEVEPGTVVEWTYEGIGSHSVTSTQFNEDVAAEWSFDKDLSSEPVSHYFPEPGVYEYKCSYDFGHIGGCGAVVVGDQDYSQEMLPCEPQ